MLWNPWRKLSRLFVRLEDKSREAQSLGNLGSVYASLKRRDEAEKVME